MNTDISCSVTWANGRTMDALNKAIQERVRLIKGETTESAVKATVINVLTSLRADTPIVKKKDPHLIMDKWDIRIEETGYAAGWAFPPRKAAHGRRVIRQGGGRGHALDHDQQNRKGRVVNLAGQYKQFGPESGVKVYRLRIFERPNEKPFYNSLVIANGKDGVFKFAAKRIARRIGRYRSISKKLLGIAMHKTHAGKGETPSGELGKLVADYADVRSSGNGYGSGQFSLSFTDHLPFSAIALKTGADGVNAAIGRAVNRTVAIINKRMNNLLFDQPHVPTFPEYARQAK